MLNTPFSTWPSFTQEEADAVSRVLLSNRVNYWTGEEGRLFEQEFADWCGTDYAVAVANGTLALDAALKALEIGEGDEVIVTSRTFIASVSSIVNAGAKPVFADIDRDSQNITAQTIQAILTPQTKAIVCVHLAGWMCDMDAIMTLADEHNLKVVEDCAQAHGASYKNRPAGSIGHIAAWSFCQDKIMTTGGEGGMVTTNDRELWAKVWAYKDHGKSWQAVYEQEHPPGFRWLHESFGTNFRMTEIQAAIGRIQLKRMQAWHASRLQNAQAIWQAAKQNALFRVPEIPDFIEHAAYKAYIFIRLENLPAGKNRDWVMREIQNQGVPCYSGSCSEVYLEKAFIKSGLQPQKRLSVAKELGETSLMFLVHPTLTADEIQKTARVLHGLANNGLIG